MLNFRVRLPCTSVIRAILPIGEKKPLVRQKVESAGEIAQYRLPARPGSNGRHLSNG